MVYLPLPLIHHFPAPKICLVPGLVIIGYGRLEVFIVQVHHQTRHESGQERPWHHHPICVIGVLRFDYHSLEVASLRELFSQRPEILPAPGPDEQFVLFAGRFVDNREES